MRRGEVYTAPLDPTEGSEQASVRPVIIVSRDALNVHSAVVLAVPCTTLRTGRRVYPSQVVVHAPEGGLDVDSVALGEQVRAIAKTRLERLRGELAVRAMAQGDPALLIALDWTSDDGGRPAR